MTKDLHVHIGGNPPTEKDYEHLINKPSINGVTLIGDLTQEDLQLTSVNSTAFWEEHDRYIPYNGQIIVYTDKTVIEGKTYSGIKIGDGQHYLRDLTFVADDVYDSIMSLLNTHIENNNRHVTVEDKAMWDAKVNCSVSGESLVFTHSEPRPT